MRVVTVVADGNEVRAQEMQRQGEVRPQEWSQPARRDDDDDDDDDDDVECCC